MKKRIFTEEEIREVLYNYQVLKKGRKTSGKRLGLGDDLVKRLLKENGVKIRTIQESNSSSYKMNNNYFSTQSSNMAYILGFIAADGNISKVDNRIDLELASVDYEILEKMREELELEREIKVYSCANGYTKNKLFFYSQQIKKDLMSYGLVPNKTYSKDYKPPYLLEKKYWIDYIRGLFDGDGSIKKGDSITFQIDCPQKEILVEIQKYFKEEHDIKTQITFERKVNVDLYRLYTYGENVRDVYKLLYTPNSLFLKRKKERFIEIL